MSSISSLQKPISLENDFPAEIQLLIIGNLHSVLDILHLEQTCRRYRSIISTCLAVWRRNLRSQCDLNNLFAPSFDNLSTLSEYRDACEAGLRFARKVELAGARNPDDPHSDLDSSKSGSGSSPRSPARAVGHRLAKIEFFDRDTRNLDLIEDVRIFPGGRYLLVLLPDRLSILDMACDSEDEEVLDYPLPDGAQCFMHFDVVGTDRIQVILEVRIDTPPEFWDEWILGTRDLLEISLTAASTPNSGASSGSRSSDEGETGRDFQVCHLGRLQFLMNESTTSFNLKNHVRVDGTRVLFYFTLPLIVVWNYVDRKFTAWAPGVGDKLEDMFITK